MIRFFKKYIIGTPLIYSFLNYETSALTRCLDTTDARTQSTGAVAEIVTSYDGYLRITQVESWFGPHNGVDEILN